MNQPSRTRSVRRFGPRSAGAYLDPVTVRALDDALDLAWRWRPTSRADIIRDGIRVVHGVLAGHLALNELTSHPD